MKSRAEGIADDLKDIAEIVFNGGLQDSMVARQGSWHRIRVFLPQARAALNISEKESYRPPRHLVRSRQLNLQSPPVSEFFIEAAASPVVIDVIMTNLTDKVKKMGRNTIFQEFGIHSC
jgi:hypothetical protein